MPHSLLTFQDISLKCNPIAGDKYFWSALRYWALSRGDMVAVQLRAPKAVAVV